MNSSDFIWLVTPYDVAPVAERLNKPWSEIEDHLRENWFNREVMVFYIPDGTFKKFRKATYDLTLRSALEYGFWNDIWDRQVIWDDVIARVWITESEGGNREPFAHFYIQSIIDGEKRFSSFRLPVVELETNHMGPDVLYRWVLDKMVWNIDHRAKEERYGPRS